MVFPKDDSNRGEYMQTDRQRRTDRERLTNGLTDTCNCNRHTHTGRLIDKPAGKQADRRTSRQTERYVGRRCDAATPCMVCIQLGHTPYCS